MLLTAFSANAQVVYYITGDTGLGLDGWSYSPTTTLTYDESTKLYTYTYELTEAGTYYFVFASNQGYSWDEFNDFWRIGPIDGNETVTLGVQTTTQVAGGDYGAYEVTLKAGTVTITFNAEEEWFKVENEEKESEEETYDTWSVVGASTILNGSTDWNISGTDNDMTTTDGDTYTLTVENCTLETNTTYEYKAAKDHAWATSVPQVGNQSIKVDETAVYTITYTLVVSTSTLTYELTKTGEAGEITHTYNIAGSNETLFGASWDATNTSTDMTLNEETGLYEWTATGVALTAGTVSFKVCQDHGWGTSYGGQNGNYEATISEAGTYNVTITFNASTHEITFTATKQGSEEEKTTITVYVKADAAPYLYAWDSSGTALNGTWPGTRMTGYAGCDDVYYAEIEASAMSIIFNNNGSNQTGDILGLTSEVGKYYYTYDGNGNYTVAEVESADELCAYTTETITVYVKADAAPYLYAWDSDDGTALNGTWSGTQMTGYAGCSNVYYAEIEASAMSIIFNDGNGSQTADITGLTSEVGTYYYYYDGAKTYAVANVESAEDLCADVYTLAGNLTSFFGTSWDATDSEGNNTMEYDSENNRYVWHGTGFITNEQLASSTDDNGIRCKVVKNHVNWIGNDNYIINTDNGLYTGGEYDLYVYYDPETGAVTHEIKQLSIEVNVTALEYGTMYYAKYALQVPDGVTSVFTGTVNDATFEPLQTWNVGDIIPAGTAVVVNAPEGTYHFAIGDTEATATEGSMLFGFDEDATTSYNGSEEVYYYYLSWGNDKDQTPENAGFFWGADNGAAFTSSAHKAYLVAPQSTGVRAIALPGATTGIDELSTVNYELSTAYDLQGRRITKLQKGVNIVNGQKVLVK